MKIEGTKTVYTITTPKHRKGTLAEGRRLDRIRHLLSVLGEYGSPGYEKAKAPND